jgi:hypothetical protein
MTPFRSRFICSLGASLLAIPALAAQETAKKPPAIADNSFLVEEAYNQEAGVVQHVGTFRRAADESWTFSFTQEWPAPSQRHQLSYTLPLLSARGAGTGVGDVALNYRYQLLGRDEETVWFAPRISALLPTGETRTSRGAGGPGVQVNLPLSVNLSPTLVTHWNLGSTITRARAFDGGSGTTRSLNAGASAIFLATPTLNFMLEGVWERTESLVLSGMVVRERRVVLVPGVRGAFNLPSGMQIVPGLGIPVEVGGSGGDRDLFLYLSIEHAFR